MLSAGPDNWPARYPNCAGRRQSPINIQTHSVGYDPSLTDFRLTGYDKLTNSLGVGSLLNFTNTGHAAAVMVSGDVFVEGGGLPGRYRTAEFHFHWGSTASVGSEHAIDGNKYCLEVSDQDNPDFVPLADSAQYIHKAGDYQMLQGIRLRSLLPADTSRYFRYSGSLTTPRCYETVSQLRNLLHESGHDPSVFTSGFFLTGANSPTRILDNWRPLQPLNGRRVQCSFPMAAGQPAASQPTGSAATAPQPTLTRGVCPGNMGYAIFGRHQPPLCVKYMSDRMLYTEAERHCQADGGHLVHVKTLDVWNTLNRFLISRRSESESNVWVGANDRRVDGQHVWTDGTSLARGDPVWDPDSQGDSPHEDCVVMAAYIRLMEAYCASRNRFFCQIDI
ncbi:hypothetical protein BaRGS_00009455 [Batillaria attramentaria]|uniref:Alpha-carbonic anhydrase domain-containing protein n=1 Tax=Batillaria attramentaria TaxID=370345 RepID=A0ABD0LID7_9CAEN